jgi:hypothetical protein
MQIKLNNQVCVISLYILNMKKNNNKNRKTKNMLVINTFRSIMYAICHMLYI